MRLFFTISLLVIFAYTASISAEPRGSVGSQPSVEQKMAELQDVLVKTSQGGISQTPIATANQNGTSLQNTNQQSPSAGLVAAPTSANKTTVDKQDNGANNQKPTMDIYQEAYSSMVNQMLPMSPGQIAKLREVFTQSQQAAATLPGVPPKPTSTSLMVDLSPQATPRVIKTSAGYITSLVFMDATGQPWPIKAYSIGDPTSFNIQWDRKGNTLLVQASTFYKGSNLAVILKGLNTPVMLTLLSGQSSVDYRVDLRVPGLGPNATFAHSGIPSSANPVLLDVLNGIPPKGSKELKVRGGKCQAWLLDKKLYLRTNLTIVSPGWESTMRNIDGTHAYQIQPAPIILALQDGQDKILTLMLDGL